MAYMDEARDMKNMNQSTDRSSMTELEADGDSTYAKAFQKCLIDLANEVYGIHEPYEIAQRALRTACEFYDADWCGVFDVDMMLDLLMPFWWYNRITGGMTETQIKDGWVMGIFEGFRKMIADNTSYYEPDVTTMRLSKPEEYAIYNANGVESFLAVPYSRREHGILFMRNPKRFGEIADMLRIIANILIQEISEQKHLDRLKINAAAADVRKDADVIVNLFGGIEIMTEKGKLVEAEMKSLICSKIFVLLMLNRHRGMSARELSELIWSDKDYGNPEGNLRSNLYRLRNMFELLSDTELIVTKQNGYRINPELKIQTDYEEFEKLFDSITPFTANHNKIKILKEAVNIYVGKLFPNGEGEHWHIPYSSKYHMKYLMAVDMLMELLNESKDYKVLYDCSMQAIRIEPNSPVVIYWLVVALRKNGAIDMAKKHLECAKSRLIKEEYQELEYRLGLSV